MVREALSFEKRPPVWKQYEEPGKTNSMGLKSFLFGPISLFLNRCTEPARRPRAIRHLLLAFLLLIPITLFSLAGCGRDGTDPGAAGRCLLPEVENMTVVFLQGSRVDDGTFICPKAYLIDRYEVTREEYVRFMRESGFWPTNDVYFLQDLKGVMGKSSRKIDLDQEEEDFPVVGVNYSDAEAYAAYYGKAIPTIREWRTAAGVFPGSTRRYPWGHRFMRFFCNSRRSGIGGPARVGTFESGKSPCGCYDMVGNVAEWTSTMVPDSSSYAGLNVHLVMGGSFNDWGHDVERSPFDLQNPPIQEEGRSRQFSIGFRTVRRDALSLVDSLVQRIRGMDEEERARAILELASSGEGMFDILRLIDFRKRIQRFHRASGLITLEPLRDLDGNGGNGILMKHADAAAGDGCLSALTGDGRKLWSNSLGLFDGISVLRNRSGRDEKIAVFNKGRRRITVHEPLRGSELWHSNGEGEPQSIKRVASGGREYAITSWTRTVSLLLAPPVSGLKPLPLTMTLSLLRLHDLETGEVIWEREFNGSIVETEWIDHGKGKVLVVLRNDLFSRSECSLIAETGLSSNHVTLPDLRLVSLSPAGSGECRYLGLDAPEGAEIEGMELSSHSVDVSFLQRKIPVLLYSGSAKWCDIGWTEIEVLPDDPVSINVRPISASFLNAAGKYKVIRESGKTGEPESKTVFDFLARCPRPKSVLTGERGQSPWLVTGIDLENRAAVFRADSPGGNKTMILLDGILGSRLHSHPVKARNGSWTGFLISSNGGSLLLIDNQKGEVVWWKKITGITAREPVFCDLGNDGKREILVCDPSGEITAIDLMTGTVRMRIKKSGAAITNLLGLNGEKDGKCEIVAGVMDEGVYILDPDSAGPDRTIKMILPAVEKAVKGL